MLQTERPKQSPDSVEHLRQFLRFEQTQYTQGWRLSVILNEMTPSPGQNIINVIVK